MKFLEEEKNKYEIKETGKYALGAFCTQSILMGETIRIFTCERISETTCDTMIADGLLSNDDPFQIQHDEYLLLDNVSIRFNHSCEPNAGFRGEGTLFALRDINPGEEITYDYSATVDPHNYTFTTMTNCLCGSPECRKSLGNVLTIPGKRLEYYKKKGALLDYIIEELNKL